MAGLASPNSKLVSEADILAAMADSSDSDLDEPELLRAREELVSVKPVSWDEDDEKNRRRGGGGGGDKSKKGGGGGGGGGGGIGWLGRAKKSTAAAEVVAAEEMSDGEIDAAKEIERKHRERLTELGLAPPSTGIDQDNNARGGGGGGGGTGGSSSSASGGGTFLQLLFSTVVHALVLTGCLVILALAAVYVDANGLWPDLPNLPPLPELPPLPRLLPANVAQQLRDEASKMASAVVGKVTDAAEVVGDAAATAAERLKTTVKTFDGERAIEEAREVVRRMTTAAISYRDVLVAEFRRRT